MTGSPGVPIALWAVPRSRSTAFLRVMVERGDLEVLHEPFSALLDQGHYKLAGQRLDSLAGLLGTVVRRSRAVRRVFVKDTTDYRYDALVTDPRFPWALVHTFLIRDPGPVVASHYALNPRVTPDETGFERLYRMFDAVRAATGRAPVVVDGDDLVEDPAGVIDAYCDRVGLARNHAALQWRPGAQPGWERTARWHQEVSRSRRLSRTTSRYPATVDNDPWLARLARRHRPFYEALAGHRLAPAPDAGPLGRRPERGELR